MREGVYGFEKYEHTSQYDPIYTESDPNKIPMFGFYDMRVIRGQKSASTKHLGGVGDPQDEV